MTGLAFISFLGVVFLFAVIAAYAVSDVIAVVSAL